jgi:hypothetical protein
MDENIFTGHPLDEPVTFGSVEPLDCALLSHKRTPFASLQKFSPAKITG